MFGRGSYAVFGVEPESLTKFQETLGDKTALLGISQYAASIITRQQNKATFGINPFGFPRADEGDQNPDGDLIEFLTNTEEEQKAEPLPATILEAAAKFFGSQEEDFSLGNKKYGFWMVFNEYKDVTDPASKKEALAYNGPGRPFKFLNKEEKKAVEEQVQAGAVMERKQFPVIVDFQHGRVYAETTNADAITTVRETLSLMGAKTFGLRWEFKGCDWVSRFLKYVGTNTRFTAEMQQRADDLARFRADEIEKFEDKNTEKVVSNFFAITELPTEHWVGLSTPAKLKLHATSEAISTSGVSAAFELLQKSNDGEVVASSVAFQELSSYFTKKGEEKQIRKDLFTLDINDQINLQDVGAAMLRGFDLPQFKRELKGALKAKGALEVRDFWYMWQEGIHNAILSFIDDVTEALEIDKKAYGLNPFDETEASEDAE